MNIVMGKHQAIFCWVRQAIPIHNENLEKEATEKERVRHNKSEM